MHWTPKTQVFRGWKYDLQTFRQTPFSFEGATFLPDEITEMIKSYQLRAIWHEERNAWVLALYGGDDMNEFGMLYPGDYLTLRTSPHSQDQWAVMEGQQFRDKYCHAQDPNEVPCACCN